MKNTQEFTDDEERFFADFIKHIGDYVRREKRKTVSISVGADGTPVIKAPMRHPALSSVAEFASGKKKWIIGKRRLMLSSAENARLAGGPLTPSEALELMDRAKDYIPGRVALYAPTVGVQYGKLGFRFMKSRWGSCSPSGDLHFNVLLMLADPDVIDSVVVHELCHIGEMNHSKRFYDRILKVMPDYFEREEKLIKNGRSLIMRMPRKNDDN